MSIYAYVQSPKNDGMVLLSKDNELLKNKDDIYNNMLTVKKFLRLVQKEKRPTRKKINNQCIYVGVHKERDVENRIREFLISWNTTDSKEIVLENAKKIGITEEFDESEFDEFNNLKEEKSNKNIFMYILIVVIVIAIVTVVIIMK